MQRSRLSRCAYLMLLVQLPFHYFLEGQAAMTLPETAYKKADAWYRKAIQVPNNGSFNEDSVAKCNHNALQAYRDLAGQIGAGHQLDDSLQFFTFFRAGELEHFFDRPGPALKFYRRAIQMKNQTRLADSFFFKPMLYAGLISYQNGNFNMALQFFQGADSIRALYDRKLDEAERLYNNLGVLHYETGNFFQAKNYFTKAASEIDPSHPYFDNLFVNYQVNLAAIEIKLKNFPAAQKIYQSILPAKLYENEIRHNMGLTFLQSGAPRNALHWFRQVVYNNSLKAGLYNDFGRAFLQMNQQDSAEAYLRKALQEHDQQSQKISVTDHGLTLRYWGDLMMRQDDPAAALSYYHKALQRFYTPFTTSNVRDNPQQFSGIVSYTPLFETLVAKAAAQEKLFGRTKEIGWLQEACNAYDAAFLLSEYVATWYDNDEARLFLSQVKDTIHSRPVAAAVQLHRITGDARFAELAYQFDQRTKASALAYRSQELQQPFKSGALQKEAELKASISRMRVRAHTISDRRQLENLQHALRKAEVELGRLRRKSVPAGGRIPSVRQLQTDLLDPNTGILSYNLGPSKLTRFFINTQALSISEQPLPQGFGKKMQQVLERVQHFGEADKKILQEWYRLLIPENSRHIRRWIIVADDVLHYLPFEILVQPDGRYLVEQQSVQYQYGTALLEKETFDFSSARTLAVAPFIKNPFAPPSFLLPQSGVEVGSIRGNVLRDTSATKPAFLKQHRPYEVLHLATHATVDDGRPGYSFIRFSPIPGLGDTASKLFLSEINYLQLEGTRLVILSACATAAGPMMQGEGVISISRSFAFAGCPNTITTLWKAEDAATAYLTAKLHKYLNQHITLDKALQMAKRDYLLDRTINPRAKSPGYWAHLVLIGDYQPGRPDPFPVWIATGSAILFTAMVGFLLGKKRGKRHHTADL